MSPPSKPPVKPPNPHPTLSKTPPSSAQSPENDNSSSLHASHISTSSSIYLTYKAPTGHPIFDPDTPFQSIPPPSVDRTPYVLSSPLPMQITESHLSYTPVSLTHPSFTFESDLSNENAEIERRFFGPAYYYPTSTKQFTTYAQYILSLHASSPTNPPAYRFHHYHHPTYNTITYDSFPFDFPIPPFTAYYYAVYKRPGPLPFVFYLSPLAIYNLIVTRTLHDPYDTVHDLCYQSYHKQYLEPLKKLFTRLYDSRYHEIALIDIFAYSFSLPFVPFDQYLPHSSSYDRIFRRLFRNITPRSSKLDFPLNSNSTRLTPLYLTYDTLLSNTLFLQNTLIASDHLLGYYEYYKRFRQTSDRKPLPIPPFALLSPPSISVSPTSSPLPNPPTDYSAVSCCVSNIQRLADSANSYYSYASDITLPSPRPTQQSNTNPSHTTVPSPTYPALQHDTIMDPPT